MLEHAWLIPVLPFASAVVIFFFGEWLPTRGAALGIAAIGIGLVQSLGLLFSATSLPLPFEASVSWFRFGIYDMQLGVYVDGITIAMLVVVTLVSFLVQVYSLGYMHDDPRFKRFFAYLSLFTASMLSLVVANNLFTFFMSWELVGLCSYLLISFWFEKPEAAYAGKKAFITTKLGDLGLFIGLLLLFHTAGTYSISQLKTYVASGFMSPSSATWIGILIFLGACGKSGQVPLFVWLPDAMEGPTPVSALIHAATMVAAGVYLVARIFFIYAVSPAAMQVVAVTGLVTAFLAATMAFAAYDIKRVLAFSTISQLGYMMLALGVGGYTAGMFHLTTHAFFKALLFLGAGSVIHAVHSNDLRDMGGLSRKMPFTFVTMLAATLAISGVFLTAGFYSKDMILEAVYAYSPAMYYVALLTAGMTTFYMFRLFFMTFMGEPRDHEKFTHAHESPGVMVGPLMVLAVLAVFAGFAFTRGDFIQHLTKLEGAAHEGGEGLSRLAMLLETQGLTLFSILAAYFLYVQSPETAESVKQALIVPFRVLEARYGFDRFYLILIELSDQLAYGLWWFDSNVVDKIFVDGFGWVTRGLSIINDWVDRVFVDGAVDGTGLVAEGIGRGFRAAQTGFVQNYLLYIAMTASLFVLFVLTQ